MRYLTSVLVLVVSLMATPATALDLIVNQDTNAKSFYDLRTYHESHPGSAKPHNIGGWRIGLNVYGPNAAEVGEVRIVANPTAVGGALTISQTEPWIYPFMGVEYNDYGMYFGHKAMVAEFTEIQAFDNDGDPIGFILPNGDSSESIFVRASVTAATPPVCKIKHMAIKKTGELKVKFTAPYDTRGSQIRIRVYNAEGTGVEAQFKYNPPYEIIRKDGTIIPDKMKVFLPAEYTGRRARIEYRVFEEDGFMSRGMTFFTLPSLEE